MCVCVWQCALALCACAVRKIASMSKGPGQSLGSPSEEHSDPYGYAALEHSANSRVSRTTSNNSMTGFMKGQLGPALKADADELPIALQWTRKKLEYAIHPSTVGFFALVWSTKGLGHDGVWHIGANLM